MYRFEARLMMVSDLDHTMFKLEYQKGDALIFLNIVPICICGQAQLREVTLQEENAEMEENERNLRYELENAQTALDANESIGDPKTTVETENDVEALKKAILEKLEERNK
ncbi:hypothetical protein DVH24_021629 [Malus domestica]|uniref:Uncharacterized protein n=1 Tax=Malus domestica TaxID=3750 RepID=A0A498JXZ8_MALDO|nr:hypothetical protein DVH24_021629 [Malus domestica]